MQTVSPSQDQQQIILAIDLGKTMGIAVNASGIFLHTEEYPFSSYYDFDFKLKDLVLRFKPSVILIPFPTRFYNVIIAHAKLMGIVCLLGDKRQIPVIEVNDSTCKKVVLGTGKAKKADIMAHYKLDNEHICDAMMFVDWYLMSV